MEAAKQAEVVSIRDYLAGEHGSAVRHEYVGGAVYAMAEVTVFRRESQWQPEVFLKPHQDLALTSLDFSLPLKLVYEGVKV